LQAGLDPPFSNDTILPPPGNFSRWELGIQPLWLNFSDPTILHVTNQSWDPLAQPNYVIVPQNVQGWIYLLITSTALPYNNLYRNYVPAAHPVSPLDLKGRQTTTPEDKSEESGTPPSSWPEKGKIEFRDVTASYG
jgi:hypothetical protein